MQPDALSLLGVGVGGLGVRFPHPETCKAFISSWPTPNPGGCTCLCHLTPPGAGVGVHHSQTFPLRCFSPLLPPAKICRVPLLASLQVPSGLSGLQRLKPATPRPSISTREPPHLALPLASPATCGNPLSASSGTVSRPRPTPPRNRTGPGRGRRGWSASGGKGTQPQWKVHPDSEDSESASELSPAGPFLDTPS